MDSFQLHHGLKNSVLTQVVSMDAFTLTGQQSKGSAADHELVHQLHIEAVRIQAALHEAKTCLTL